MITKQRKTYRRQPSSAPPRPRRRRAAKLLMRSVVVALVVAAAAVSILAPAAQALAQPDPDLDFTPPVSFRATVIEVGPPTEEDLGYGMIVISQLVTVRALTGPLRGVQFTFTHANPNDPAFEIDIKTGMDIVMSAVVIDGEIQEPYVEDIARDRPLLWLAVGFFVLLIGVGGRRGLRSAITLAVTIAIILRAMLPALLAGANPVLISVAVGVAATLVTVLAIAGFTRKALAAIIGTTGGVVAAGALAWLTASLANLTGFGVEEVRMLTHIPQGTAFDFRGLLFAGMLIGALGAAMDVGMSVASSMDEVRRADPNLNHRGLLAAGMNVGRDVMGTMANTLVLAYTGASIPLLLLFMAYDMSLLRIVSLDLVATEIARALTGSMGLVLSIPITALAGAALFARQKADKPRPAANHEEEPA